MLLPLLRKTLALSLLCLCHLPVYAQSDDALQFHYFGSLGVTRSSSDRVGYVRDLTQPTGNSGGNISANQDSSLGAQVNYRFSQSWDGAIQAVSSYRYDGTYRPEVNWAYVRKSTEQGTRIRMGRMGTDFYLLSDSREVGYANLAARPSPDFFGQLPIFYFDGLDMAHTIPLEHSLLTGKVFWGRTAESVPFGSSEWFMGDSPIFGANLDWNRDAWSFRIGVARLTVREDWPYMASLAARGVTASSPGNVGTVARAMSMANKDSNYYSAGVIYDKHPWQVQVMVNAVQQESYAYQNYRSAYVLAGYRWGDFTPYGGVSRSFSPAKQLDLSGLTVGQAALVNRGLGFSHTNQTTYTLGLRWDFTAKMDLKVQWDGIRGASDSTFLYRNEQPGWNGKTDVLTFIMDFAI